MTTTRYTDQQLEAMLADIESDRVERKQSFGGDAPTKAREAVCAFANDLPNHRQAGVVFIGARDDGTPAGLDVTDKLLLDLSDMKTDGNILPPPSLNVSKRTLRGADMAVVTVEPADSPPVRFRGRIHVRWGPRRGIATAQDERMLSEKRKAGDRPFDVSRVPGATLDDLNQRLFEDEYLPAAFAPDVLDANERTFAQRLAATKMVETADGPAPTVVGMLTLGKRVRDFIPGAYVQFLRVADTELASDRVVDEAVLDGPLSEMLRLLDDKLRVHIQTAVTIGTGPVEQRRADYPLGALQQLARNAVLHRTYEGTNAPVRVYWFEDRIEIQNPGGPFGVVTAETFGEPGVTDYRNPNLAEAMRVLGFIQRFGFGIQQARRDLVRNGNGEPSFDVQQHYILCKVRRAA